MKKKFSHTLQFIINVFLICLMVNTCVVSPHILTAYEHTDTLSEFTTAASFNIVLLVAGISALVFAVTSIILYLFAVLFGKIDKSKSFWYLMLTGIAATVIMASFFENTFAAYNPETNWITAIFGFSIMVALASQYQFYLDENTAGETNLA